VQTPHARLREFLPDARELALLFAVRGLACVIAWNSGFRALSDDDYARISIAQRFAQLASFDPSGTSWLPAPFWIYGAAFRCFGTGLGVARATAIALSLFATVLVYVAARLLGAGRFSALLGAVFSTLLVPYSLFLGLAAVPEVPSAALLLFSAATLVRNELGLRALGGLSITAACLSRYEAWPVALVFAAYCSWDALRERRQAWLGCAVLAIAGPALWLVLGRLEHGDALFFVARVTAYRRALGGEQVSFLRRLLEYPRLLIWEGLLLCPLLVIPYFLSRKTGSGERLEYRRALLALGAMLGFLMLGSVRDGVPTHHAARVLLPLWFFASVSAGHLLGRLGSARPARVRATLVAAFVVAAPLIDGVSLPEEGFAQRAPELEAGRAAREHTNSGLAIDTPDYGFFAVQAGFGSPLGTRVLDDHDPRHAAASPFGSAQSLDQALRERKARFALVTAEHSMLLDPRCEKVWRNSAFVLFQCRAAH